MCGILGSIDLNITQKLLESLHHRGPDGQGLEQIALCNKSICLAHTRLSILDLSPAGKQPMQSADGRWWVAFNGEIYNHLDLRHRLQTTSNKSLEWRGHSDTETLLELIALYGVEKTVQKLNGMFAFAALDMQEEKLYLVRDPFGIKPLYYSAEGQAFAFASEVRVLKQLGLNTEINHQSLQLFMTLRYSPAPTTLWKGIRRLAPGHMLCVNVASQSHEVSRYISPVTHRFTGSMDDAVNAYKQEMQAAINRQLLSDVSVGVLLSGGIDSALVAAMAKDSGRDLPCFSVGFGQGHPECEIEAAAETAQVLGLPFSFVEVTPAQLLDALPSIVGAVEEPLGTTSIMPMWYLVQKAREDVTVVLTGQGTDEPWGGYRRYQVEMVHRMLPWNGLWKTAKAVGGMLGNLPEFMERGLRTLPVTDMSTRAVEACALFSSEERGLLLGNSSDGGAVKRMRYWLDWMNSANCAPAEKMMRMDARMNLADDLLLYGDKLSMAVSLEARVPMLDIELVRFVESLPLQYRVALRKTKIVHKQMAESYLPASIVHRKKKGFGVPFGAWSRGPWRSFVQETLLDKNAPHWEALNRTGVKTIWNQHLKGRPDRSRQLFSLLMLALWWKQQ